MAPGALRLAVAGRVRALQEHRSTVQKKKTKTSSAIDDVILLALAARKTDSIGDVGTKVAAGSDSDENVVDSDAGEMMDTGSWNSEDEDVVVGNNELSEPDDLSSADEESQLTSSAAKVSTKSKDIVQNNGAKGSIVTKSDKPIKTATKTPLKSSQCNKKAGFASTE